MAAAAKASLQILHDLQQGKEVFQAMLIEGSLYTDIVGLATTTIAVRCVLMCGRFCISQWPMPFGVLRRESFAQVGEHVYKMLLLLVFQQYTFAESVAYQLAFDLQ